MLFRAERYHLVARRTPYPAGRHPEPPRLHRAQTHARPTEPLSRRTALRGALRVMLRQGLSPGLHRLLFDRRRYPDVPQMVAGTDLQPLAGLHRRGLQGDRSRIPQGADSARCRDPRHVLARRPLVRLQVRHEKFPRHARIPELGRIAAHQNRFQPPLGLHLQGRSQGARILPPRRTRLRQVDRRWAFIRARDPRRAIRHAQRTPFQIVLRPLPGRDDRRRVRLPLGRWRQLDLFGGTLPSLSLRRHGQTSAGAQPSAELHALQSPLPGRILR